MCAALATACAKRSSMDQYSYRDVGQSSLVQFGTVLKVREVGITGKNTGTGGLVGAGAGAGAGAYAGDGSGKLWAIAGGALAGAAIGSMAEQAGANRTGLEYTIVKENGKTVTIVQEKVEGEPVLPRGSRVMIQTSGSYDRVLPADDMPEKIKRPKGIKVED